MALASGIEACGYTSLDDVQALYRADAELVRCRATEALHTEQIALLDDQIEAYRAVVTQRAVAVTALKERNAELFSELMARDKLYQTERVKPRWGGTVAWTTAAALAAELLGWLTTLDHQSLMLGMMPGGIAELSLTAEALQLSVPLVTALQVLRLLLVLFLAEPCFRYWRKRAG